MWPASFFVLIARTPVVAERIVILVWRANIFVARRLETDGWSEKMPVRGDLMATCAFGEQSGPLTEPVIFDQLRGVQGVHRSFAGDQAAQRGDEFLEGRSVETEKCRRRW